MKGHVRSVSLKKNDSGIEVVMSLIPVILSEACHSERSGESLITITCYTDEIPHCVQNDSSESLLLHHYPRIL